MLAKKNVLPDRESNPGLPRDRRRSSPLDYRGFDGKENDKGVSDKFQTYAPGQKLILSVTSGHGSSGRISSGIVGSVVECSPATRAARVRFPDDAKFLWWFHVKCDKKFLETRGIDPRTSHMLSERSTI